MANTQQEVALMNLQLRAFLHDDAGCWMLLMSVMMMMMTRKRTLQSTHKQTDPLWPPCCSGWIQLESTSQPALAIERAARHGGGGKLVV